MQPEHPESRNPGAAATAQGQIEESVSALAIDLVGPADKAERSPLLAAGTQADRIRAAARELCRRLREGRS